MTKVEKALLAVFLGAALAWAGGDPWTSKPYQSWDREDVLKVLNHSPWSRAVQVTARWKSASEQMEMPSGPDTMGGGGESSRGGSPGMGGGQQSHSPGGYGAPGGPGMAVTPQAWFQARWMSSRVVREAVARYAVLNGAVTEAQAEQYVAQAPKDYEIELVAPDMTPFEKLDEAALKQDAYLEVKKKKHERVPASSAQVQRDKAGKITKIIFSFPKTEPGGEPVIAPEEKEARFVCVAGKDLALKFDFDLGKMVSQQGRDL